MNGFQAISSLLPIAKYDERYARSLAKYALNIANASRLFYSSYLPENNQDGFVWASSFDHKNYIAYESMIYKFEGMYNPERWPYYFDNYYKQEYSGKEPF